MKRKKYLLLALILSLLWTPRVNAECTKEEKQEFEKVKDKYKIDYEFNKNNKTYTLTFYYTNPEKYGYKLDDTMGNPKFLTMTEENFVFAEIKPGKYNIEVIGATQTCNTTLKNITLDLPKYNVYYGDPLCEGYEEFYLCQETYDKDVDRETFVSRINTYKKTKLKKEEEIKKNQKEQNVIDKVLEYVENNLIEIIIIVVFIILLVITTITTAKSIRKSRRLE